MSSTKMMIKLGFCAVLAASIALVVDRRDKNATILTVFLTSIWRIAVIVFICAKITRSDRTQKAQQKRWFWGSFLTAQEKNDFLHKNLVLLLICTNLCSWFKTSKNNWLKQTRTTPFDIAQIKRTQLQLQLFWHILSPWTVSHYGWRAKENGF